MPESNIREFAVSVEEAGGGERGSFTGVAVSYGVLIRGWNEVVRHGALEEAGMVPLIRDHGWGGTGSEEFATVTLTPQANLVRADGVFYSTPGAQAMRTAMTEALADGLEAPVADADVDALAHRARAVDQADVADQHRLLLPPCRAGLAIVPAAARRAIVDRRAREGR